MAVSSIYVEFTGCIRIAFDAWHRIKLQNDTIREWNITFGQTYAKEVKRRARRRGDKWHMDEMCLVMKGKKHWLWRAADQDGYELDILLQPRRNKKAAKSDFSRNY